jgi:endo-1,4-beta-xylanase
LKISGVGAAALAWPGVALAEGSNTLRDIAAAKNLLVGAAVPQRQLVQPDFAALLAAQCSIVVAENAMKWEPTQPERDRYDFKNADELVSFADAHGQKVRGHNLCWHQSNPAWLESTITPTNAAGLLRQHILVVAGRYKGRIHSWDVVNEAIHPEDHNAGSYRNSVWLKNLGEGYIDLAFRAAAEADPGALLTYNDFGIEHDAPDQDHKRDAILALLRGMRKRGVPLHALGIQSHITAHAQRPNFSAIHGFLKELAKMNLQVFITEMDVDDRDLPADVAKRDHEVAEIYRDYLRTVLQHQNVKAVLTWGLTDRSTWLSSYRPRPDKLAKRPLPFDTELRAKPAFAAMVEAIGGCEPRGTEDQR